MSMSVARPPSDAALAWAVFICRACGLVYDEALGDADSGLAPGTRFADIPDDWSCPLCGVTKADFEPWQREPARSPAAQPDAAGGASRTTATTANAPEARHDPGCVIVGAGRAGWQVAQALREGDARMPITLVTACPGDVYDKPLLSVALARGIAPDALPRETGAAAARRLGIRLVPHTQAVQLLPAGRQLRTTRGTFAYRHLVLAHGAQARTLPALPASLCWYINHLQAYAALRTALGDGARRVAVVGAGLIGAELANDLALAGHAVTVLDVQARPLAALLDAAQSQELVQAWRRIGLAFWGGAQVRAVVPTPQGRQLVLHDGRTLEADHIVVAAGLQTPGRLAQDAGLAWDQGIAVEASTLATSVAGIYALGDCISIGGQVSRYIEPIGRQARAIADGILGAPLRAYRSEAAPVRIKTGSLPFTVAAPRAAAGTAP